MTLSPSFLVEQFAQPVDHGAQRVLGIRLALGTAQVRGQDDLGLVLEGVDDGGQRGHDARVVGDGRAVFGERHIEIDADKDPLVGQIDVANGELGHVAFCERNSPQFVQWYVWQLAD